MGLPIIGALAGGVISALGARSAGRSQERAADKATASNERIANQQMAFARETQNEIQQRLRPYEQIGNDATNVLRGEVLNGFQTSPGYEFARSEGQRAVDGSAAARGMTFSGSTLKAQERFGQGLANQEYGNWLNRVTGLSQTGQNAAAMSNNAATNAASMSTNALSNLGAGNAQAIYGAGNAQAAGAVGVANAFNTGIGNALGAYQYQQQAGGGALPGGSVFNGVY